MASNIDVKISADTTDLAAKFAIAKAESSTLTSELNKLAREAAAAGGTMSNELRTSLYNAAEASVKAKAEVADLQSQIRKTKETTNDFSDALGFLKGGLASLGLAIGIQEVISFGKEIFNNAADLQHQANALGVSTDQLQAFQYAARNAGVDTETADAAMQKFYVGLGQAAEGSGTALKAFQDMGLNVGQLATNTDDAAGVVASALLKMNNQYERNAAIREIFGRGGQDVNAMLTQLAQGFDANLDAAKRNGEYIGGDLTESAEKARIALDKADTELKDSLTPDLIAATTALTNFVVGFHNAQTGAAEFQKSAVALGSSIAQWFGLSANKDIDAYFDKIAHPPAVPVATAAAAPKQTAEQVDVAGLNALDSKLRERLVITKEISDAERTLTEAKAAGDVNGIKQATEAVSDLKKKLDELNKVAADPAAKAAARNAAEINKRADQELAQAERNLQDQEIAIERSNSETSVALAKDALTQKKALLGEEYASHQINAQQEYDGTVAALNAEAEAEVNAVMDDMDRNQGNVAVQVEDENKITLIVQQNLDARAAAHEQYLAKLHAEYEKQFEQYKEMNSQIESAESQLVSDIFTKRQGLGADLAEIGYKLVQDEVANDLKVLTQHLEVNAGMLASDQATAQGGILWKAAVYAYDAIAAIVSEAKHTAAVAAGTATRVAITQTGAVAGAAAEKAAGATTITSDAAKAAAGAYQSAAQIPYIGWILGPAAAAAAFVAVEAFGSFAQGTNVVPHDMVAQIHAGERIVPAADNSALLRAVGASDGKSGGGDTHFTVNQTFHATPQKGLRDMLDESASDFDSWFHARVRDGYIRTA